MVNSSDVIKTLFELKGICKESFKDTKEELKNINNHLSKLNSQVAKNTSFRDKFFGGMKIISILLACGLATFILSKVF